MMLSENSEYTEYTEYLYRLADSADPEKLWKMNPLEARNLTSAQKAQIDTGVALRRYARHLSELNKLLGKHSSLLISPLSKNGVATKIVPMPEEHSKLLRNSIDNPEKREPKLYSTWAQGLLAAKAGKGLLDNPYAVLDDRVGMMDSRGWVNGWKYFQWLTSKKKPTKNSRKK